MNRSSLLSVAQAPGVLSVNVKALNYRNDRIPARLVDEGLMNPAEAALLFDDTLKFLALSNGEVKLSPPARIDLGWHNFILHTRDYDAFCRSCFGRFIHHEPGSGLMVSGVRLTVDETVSLARSTFGELSSNWNNIRGETCGSNGC